MKKHLLIIAMLAMAILAFAYNSRPVYTELTFPNLDMCDYVTPLWPSINHPENISCPNWYFEISNGNETYNTDTSPVILMKVGRFRLGPEGVVPIKAWAWFNPQIFSPPGNSAGQTITMKLKYLPNPDEATNTVIREYLMPPGTSGVFLHGNDGWVLPETILGSTQPPEQFSLTVNSTNYPGAAIWKDGADTSQVTPWTFTGATADVAGTYTVVMDNVTWLPPTYVYDGLTDQTVNFVGVYTPDFAFNPNPANGHDFEIAHDAVATTYDLAWDAPAGPITGYKIVWMNEAAVDLGNALTWTTPEIAEGTYTWSVIPYVNDPLPAPGAKTAGIQRELAPIQARVIAPQTKGEPVNPPVWTFTITRQAPPQMYDFVVESNYPGAAIWKNGGDTGFETPYTFTGTAAQLAGEYSVVLAEVTVWTPATYTYTAGDPKVTFMGQKVPGWATNPSPQIGATITVPYGQPIEETSLKWEPPTTGPRPTGYYVYWGETDENPACTDTNPAVVLSYENPPTPEVYSWTTDNKLPEGHYYWKVVPFIIDPPAPAPAPGNSRASGLDQLSGTHAKATAGTCADAPNWHFYIKIEVKLTVRCIDENAAEINVPIVKGNVNTGFTTPHDFIGTKEAVQGLYWVLPLGNYVVQGTTDTQYLYLGLVDTEVIFEPYDPTVPVELSSFTATLTAQNFVKLTWVSQTETGMWGYRVYRAESADQASALLLTPTLIPATNTSTTQVYNLEDKDVEIGTTYWYWLEAVELTGAGQFYGQPVSVTVQGEVPPVLPTASAMDNAYPNPFKQSASTSIDVRIKEGENGTVTIYNILGQAVKTFRVSQGTHKLTWNGQDARGNNCGSGIYFYKLSTPDRKSVV